MILDDNMKKDTGKSIMEVGINNGIKLDELQTSMAKYKSIIKKKEKTPDVKIRGSKIESTKFQLTKKIRANLLELKTPKKIATLD
jgi:hypothetical protein